MTQMTVSKVLSANDTGETGGHQAGLLVPKSRKMLAFFPPLDSTTKNPRVHLLFEDDSGTKWEFAFIHYNNRLFGGTRNEYRLTRMTQYMRAARLVEGDTVMLRRALDGSYSISHRRHQVVAERRDDTGRTILQLHGRWAIIDL